MLKKLTALFLCVFFVLAGCNSAETDEKKSDVPEEPKIDMGGYECLILQDKDIVDPFRYKEGTLFADTVLARISEIETNYNCKITLGYQGANNDLSSYVTANMGAGSYIGEMLHSMDSNVASNIAYAGYFYPLTELKDIIDYSDSEKYGGANILEVAMLNSIPYTVSPMMWPEKQSTWVTYVFVANSNLMKQYGFNDPREYIEQKNWTWDSFEECIKNMTVTEGEKKIYSLHAFPNHMAKNAVLSNGVSGITEVDGAVKTDIYGDNCIDALNWAKRILTDYKDNIDIKGSGWPDTYNSFLNNECMMTMTSTGLVTTNIVYEIDEFALLPFPCGPKGTYGRWAGVFEAAEGIGIFTNANEPEYAAHIINELYKPFEGLETYDKLVDYYAQNVFFDRSDAEIYLDVGKYARYSYWTVGGDNFWGSVGSQLMNKSGAELVQKYGPQLEAVVEKYIGTNYDYMSENLYK
jgi:hypothetical protein